MHFFKFPFSNYTKKPQYRFWCICCIWFFAFFRALTTPYINGYAKYWVDENYGHISIKYHQVKSWRHCCLFFTQVGCTATDDVPIVFSATNVAKNLRCVPFPCATVSTTNHSMIALPAPHTTLAGCVRSAKRLKQQMATKKDLKMQIKGQKQKLSIFGNYIKYWKQNLGKNAYANRTLRWSDPWRRRCKVRTAQIIG